MRSLAAFLLAGSLAALPAMAQTTRTHTVTNPAGSHSMTITKSGNGANRTMTRTMTNTEGHKTLSSSRTMIHAKKSHVTKASTRTFTKTKISHRK